MAQINFIYFTDETYKRVIKHTMSEMHKLKGGGIFVGDPNVMAPGDTLKQYLKIYNTLVKRKVKSFDSHKEAQIKLYNLGYKKAVCMEDTDMKNIFQTKKVDIPKPNNHCKTVRGRDPWDTDWLIERTDKNPLSQNIKNRLTNYVDVNKGEPTIANILKFTELDINDIKYDIKLGYIKAYKTVDGKKKYK